MLWGGSHLFGPSVAGPELHVVWVGIAYARFTLRGNHLVIENDFSIII